MHFKNLYRNLYKGKNNYNKNSEGKGDISEGKGDIARKSSMLAGASPKLTFFVGLLIGISIISTTGFFVVLGRNLSSDSDSDSDSDSVEVAGEVVNTNKAAAPTPTPTNANPGNTIDASKLSPVTEDDHVIGNENAKITLIEYSDFQCPFCSRHHPTMEALAEKYGDQIRWVYRHFPLTSLHPEAIPAAEASECAGEQDKFWEYSDKLFENQSQLSEAYYGTLAQELNLDKSKFDECLESDKFLSVINKQSPEGQAAGARGTPATFIGDQLVSGAVPLDQFESIIDSLLSE